MASTAFTTFPIPRAVKSCASCHRKKALRDHSNADLMRCRYGLGLLDIVFHNKAKNSGAQPLAVFLQRTFQTPPGCGSDRYADARFRHGARLHRFHPCRAPGVRGAERTVENNDGSWNDMARLAAAGCGPVGF